MSHDGSFDHSVLGQKLAEDRECTMLTYFPETLRARGVEKSTDVSPVVRDGSGSPQRCGARWWMQGTISKGFINSTEIVTAATTPRRAIEIACNQVNFLRNHNVTKSLDELLGDAFFLGENVADMQGQYSKELLTTDCGSTKCGT